MTVLITPASGGTPDTNVAWARAYISNGGLFWPLPSERVKCPGKRKTHAPYFYGLDCHCWVPAGEPADWALLPASREWKHGGVFHFGARCFVVAGGDFDGGDHFCRRYASAGLRAGGAPGHRGKLDLVGIVRRWHDDGFLFCALLAAG